MLKGNSTYDTVKVTNSGVTVKNIVVDKNLTIEASVGDGTHFIHLSVAVEADNRVIGAGSGLKLIYAGVAAQIEVCVGAPACPITQ